METETPCLAVQQIWETTQKLRICVKEEEAREPWEASPSQIDRTGHAKGRRRPEVETCGASALPICLLSESEVRFLVIIL